MPRMIALYEKHGENLVNRFDILHDDLEFFREILGRPAKDPLLYGVYKIDKAKNKKIFERFGVAVDLEKYDAFLEYGEDLI
ncbi:DUF7683 domain-containing protein [Ensifer adhaerens]|uniref:DUF7683 domain-containing protein n=1 Tax=Ensifer adhaerens TaxID=106592 RepID=UPI0011773876|nr:hypothetical protein [Ensifer adhaerens]